MWNDHFCGFDLRTSKWTAPLNMPAIFQTAKDYFFIIFFCVFARTQRKTTSSKNRRTHKKMIDIFYFKRKGSCTHIEQKKMLPFHLNDECVGKKNDVTQKKDVRSYKKTRNWWKSSLKWNTKSKIICYRFAVRWFSRNKVKHTIFTSRNELCHRHWCKEGIAENERRKR